jgi:imidazolonepropionase-like amidohydrolase
MVTSDAPQPLILRGGHVFDSDTRSFRNGLDVLCIDGRIARIAPGLDASGAHELNCAGRFVLPGLIDCHVHLTFAGGPSEAETQRGLPLPVRAWRASEHARRTLDAGFTTVRDMGPPTSSTSTSQTPLTQA